jgi:drug/metabolite transporter (DMT)-like permease
MTDNARGALLMTIGMAAFVINDTFMKLTLAEIPLFQALFLRGVGTTVFFAVLAWRLGALSFDLPARDLRMLALRVFAEAMSAWTFIYALAHMPLANLTAILQALPLTITMAGAIFLGERVGWRRWLAIAVGFVGVLLIVRPGTEGFDRFSVIALVAVAFVTLRDIATRRMSRAVPSMTAAFATAIGVTGFAGIGALTVDWAPMTGAIWIWIGAMVLFIAAGYVLSISAVRVGELGFVTPFRYTSLVWALALGFLVFGDWPDGLTMAGAALVVATGLFTFYRERVRQRRAA